MSFHNIKKLRSLTLYFLLMILLVSGTQGMSLAAPTAAVAGPGNSGANYAEALQKTILFYEAQRSGSLSTSSIPTRLTWRGDAQLTDGLAQGVDLTGGMVDAGDNVKYGFPYAQAMQMLAWGAVEYRSAYANSGQLTWLLNQLRWANDYLIKAHPSPNVFWHQVGLTNSDHGLWIPIVSTQYLTNRTAFKVDTTCPGSDVAGETAAAMATASIVFRPTDPAYADTLLTHAEQLYTFADTYRGKYSDCNQDPGQPYISWSGYNDELVWGAIWVYKAKEAKTAGSGTAYLDKAKAYYPTLGLEANQTVHKYKWTHVWDDNTFADYVMMAKLTGEAQYKADAERWLNWWTVGGVEHGADGTKVSYTPGGHARLDQWGSLRYAANTAFNAFVYSDWTGDAVKKARYKNFAEQQVNYILGQNPRNASYIGGFGSTPPQHPHHRTAHGSWAQQQSIPADHRHILYGALAGSPGTDDSFNDSIADFVANEVALDYNAGLAGALAKMTSLYGGTPIPDSSFPLPDKPYACRDEWANFIIYYSSGASGIGPSVFVENRSGWPGRMSDKLKFRYFFTLDAASISDVTVSLGAAPAGTTISGPTLWDAANKVYYVTVDITGTPTYPGYAYGPSGPEVRFNINSASNSWNNANDWSFQNIDNAYSGGWGSHKYGGNIPMYEGLGNVKLCGGEPPSGPTATNTPTNTPVASNTPTNTPVVTNTPTNTPVATNTPTNTPVASNTPTNTPVATNTPTNTPIASNTPTNTPVASNTPTNTPLPTNTPTNTPVVTPTPTNTPVPGGNLCATPTVITGGGSYAIPASGVCFKYVNATFTRGAMWSVMNGSSSTVSNTVKWYGGRNETVTNCINDTQVLNGNGAQLNNFTVAKDSANAMYVTITTNQVNTVSMSIQNWQNGTGCSVAPTPQP